MAKDKARYDHALSRFQRAHRDETQVPPYMHSFDVVYGPIANDRAGLQIEIPFTLRRWFVDAR